MKAKKILAVLVGVAMACSMAACGSSSDSSDAADDTGAVVSEKAAETEETAEETADDAEEEESTGTEIAFEETTYVDNEDYTFTVEGITIGKDGCTLDVEITNKSADQDYVFLETIKVDGVGLFGHLLSDQDDTTFAAGETLGGKLRIDNDGLQGLNYTDLEITLEGEEMELQTETFHVYPYGEENVSAFVWEAQESDQVLIDNEYVTMAVVDVHTTESGGLCMYYYIQNKSDLPGLQWYSEDSVDGNTLEDAAFTGVMEAGEQMVSIVLVYEDELGGEAVKDVKTMESTITGATMLGDTLFEETVSINLQ